MLWAGPNRATTSASVVLKRPPLSFSYFSSRVGAWAFPAGRFGSSQRPGVSEAVLDRLDGVTPAFSVMIVKGLASPELLMEIDITAVVADQRP